MPALPVTPATFAKGIEQAEKRSKSIPRVLLYSVAAAHVLPTLCTMLGSAGGSLRQDAALQVRAAMLALPTLVFPDLQPLLST